MLNRARKVGNRRNQLTNSNPRYPLGPRLVSATKAASTITLSFDRPVVLAGTPAITFTPNATPRTLVSVTQSAPGVLAALFSGAVTSATSLTLPLTDGLIKAAAGGGPYISTFPVT